MPSSSGCAKLRDRAFGEFSANELYDIVKLRYEVYVVEMNSTLPLLDVRDAEPSTRHVWIAADSSARPIAAYARALAAPEGGTYIGRVATHPTARRRGLATLIIEHILGATGGPWKLDALLHLVGWYEDFGFQMSGDPHDNCHDNWGLQYVSMGLDAGGLSDGRRDQRPRSAASPASPAGGG